MDTSEQYIKMCEKAEEIQNHFNERKFDEGSFWFRGQKKDIVTNKYFAFFRKFGDVWLPRQDQLQEMILEKHENEFKCLEWVGLVESLIGYYEKMGKRNLERTKSLEQLWLALVMKKKFGKVWDGREWGADREQKRKAVGIIDE
jgi:hypothetical protein